MNQVETLNLKRAAVLVFEGGTLTIYRDGFPNNGDGQLAVADDTMEYENDPESSRVYRVLRLPRSELESIRDHINQWLAPYAGAPGRPASADILTQRLISHDEARQVATRLINSHFNQEPCARISIPARPDHDDDLLIVAYIQQRRAEEADVQQRTMTTLAAAMRKFAPDLMDEFAVRWKKATSDQAQALEAFLAFLRGHEPAPGEH